MDDPLIETWNISSRTSLYVLDAITPEALGGTGKPYAARRSRADPATRGGTGKGRSVGAMFAHLHAVRLMWLEVAAPELMKGLAKIDKEAVADKQLLQRSLEQSAHAMGELLKQGLAAGKIKGFKRSPAAFMGYLIAHEGYHLGEIGMTLKQAGHPLDQKIAYGMWEWGKL